MPAVVTEKGLIPAATATPMGVSATVVALMSLLWFEGVKWRLSRRQRLAQRA